MQIAFHGAAQTVTGSKHLITFQNGRKVLLDCGLFQGMGPETDSLNRTFGFDPTGIDAMLLSHAHIDHCATRTARTQKKPRMPRGFISAVDSSAARKAPRCSS